MFPNINIIKADITTLEVDAIVNAANNSLMGGGGVDGAIHRAAGPELKEACRILRGCKTGEAKLTKGYLLPAKYIIHTVGPVWENGTKNEIQLLEAAYKNALKIAQENQLKSIAFPAISTGAYRFPFDLAFNIAVITVQKHLQKNSNTLNVTFVAFSEKDEKLMNKRLNTL